MRLARGCLFTYGPISAIAPFRSGFAMKSVMKAIAFAFALAIGGCMSGGAGGGVMNRIMDSWVGADMTIEMPY